MSDELFSRSKVVVKSLNLDNSPRHKVNVDGEDYEFSENLLISIGKRFAEGNTVEAIRLVEMITVIAPILRKQTVESFKKTTRGLGDNDG